MVVPWTFFHQDRYAYTRHVAWTLLIVFLYPAPGRGKILFRLANTSRLLGVCPEVARKRHQ